MAIKNKDGTPFRLNRPNPITTMQEWQNMILYNCQWKGTVVPDALQVKIKKMGPITEVRKAEPPPEPAPELPKIEVKIEQIEETSQIHDGVTTASELNKSAIPASTIKNIVRVHCLPAEIKIEKDPLYDEEREILVYGEKFAFEAVIMERGDFAIRFWTNQMLSKQSIIFPSVFIKGEIKFGDYRWWKIDNQEEKAGGYIVTAVASEIQPDFS
jgi:hypothetical protein